MKLLFKVLILNAALALSLNACEDSREPSGPNATPSEPQDIVFTDVSQSNLPAPAVSGRDMDARPVDIDGDGDLDLVIAVEFGRNRILINDGTAVFSDESQLRLPGPVHDSEDIGLADFDGDGDPDLVFVSEDDRVNEMYLNNGQGIFNTASDRIPVQGTSNAVLVFDIDKDGDQDILIGNAGQNVVLVNDGAGFFTDESGERLPQVADATQDLEAADIDGDGDKDILVGNEDDNRLLLNDGSGVFSDGTQGRLPLDAGQEETREADFGDINGDGAPDILFANVEFIAGKNRQNRLLLNDGHGVFTDVTPERLPAAAWHTVDGDFADIDKDGDLDIILANFFGGNYSIYLNSGNGTFSDASTDRLPVGLSGDGVDIEAADFNGDGFIDLFLTHYRGADILLLGQARE